jgi:hypothetical protein
MVYEHEMSKNPLDESFSDEEADRRATQALRRALTTPYKPQREMVGKVGRPSTRKRKAKKIPAKK